MLRIVLKGRPSFRGQVDRSRFFLRSLHDSPFENQRKPEEETDLRSLVFQTPSGPLANQPIFSSRAIAHASLMHPFVQMQTRSFSAEKKKKEPKLKRRSKSTSKALLAQEQKLHSALEKGGERVIQVKNLDKQIPQYSQSALGFVKEVPQYCVNGMKTVLKAAQILFSDPQRAMEWMRSMKDKIYAEAKHLWLGSKLLYADVSTSIRLVRRVLKGNSLSRRERKMLQRTTVDLLRLVPFSFFIIIPFMEVFLPVALKLFPNMLPSTFRDSYQKEEDMRRQLQLRVALAEFLQETIKDVVKDTRDAESSSEEKKSTVSEVLDFIIRAQKGERLTSEETLKMSKLFNDELMLDNISRPQLVGMCRFMNVSPYGNDSILRFQLRNKIRQLKSDDQDIIWEGLNSLDKEELQQACMDRGMRATGLTKAGYIRQMKQWLDLSINKNVPASLLILSRALNITSTDNLEDALATSMSSLDEEVVTEVALQAGTSGEETSEMRERRLESIRYQNEMIADEDKFREEAKKEKSVEETESPDEEVTESVEALESNALHQELQGEEPFDKSSAESLTLEPSMKDTAEEFDEADIGKRELTLDEVSALESLAFKSLVEKERQAVDQMKLTKSEMDVESLLSAGRIGSKKRESKSTDRMMKKIDSMISALEVELDKVDKTIGDKLNVLDKDSDGLLTAEEIKVAVKTILRKYNTEESAEWVVSQIDANSDGIVSVEELVDFIDKKRQDLEMNGNIPVLPQEPVESKSKTKKTKKGTTTK